MDDPVRFSHVFINVPLVTDIVALLNQLLDSPAHAATCITIATDLKQRREIVARAPEIKFEVLEAQRRILFVFKPLKASKVAIVFDPKGEGELATDRSSNGARAVAEGQRGIFDELRRRLGNKGLRVLLVEDNKTSQVVSNSQPLRAAMEIKWNQVLTRFLSKISMEVDCVLDGEQCTEKVFSQPHDYYSLIFVCYLVVCFNV
jgi:hypothetical protein